jgi:RimJ/RimL family protein N-acetyltransferase
VPDIPRLVETRSMLLGGGCRIFGRVDEGHVVIVDADSTLASVIGRPDPREIAEAVATLRGELLADEPTTAHVAAALPGWREEAAAIHTRAAATPFPPAALPTRELRGSDPLDHLAPVLREEIEDARSRTPVVVACADGLPVAFCYASSETESWWDVSIDTVEAYRGRGFAAAAFLRLAAPFAERGKAPVWGALDSNPASLRLAARLGFVPVDRLTVFSRLDPETNAPRA